MNNDMLFSVAIQLIKDIRKVAFLGDEGTCIKIGSMIDDFFKQFTVSTQERHGHWIYNGTLDDDGNRECRCSVCGAGVKQSPSCTVPFCWNCGTPMDEG